MDMYSRVKRRKSLRRNTYGMQAHHKVMSKSKDPEEEEGTEGMFFDCETAIFAFQLFAYNSFVSVYLCKIF